MSRSRITLAVAAGLLCCVPTVTFAVVAASGSYYRCDDLRVVSEVLAHHRPASDLAYPSRTALKAEPATAAGEKLHLGDLADWTVLEDGERRVAIVQPHVGPIDPASWGATWLDLAVAERVGPLGRSGRPTWRVRPLEVCVMHREFARGEARWAMVGLDPEHPARPSDTHVNVLVRTANCGPPGGERVTLLKQEYDVDTVGLILGVLPARPGASCAGDSLTPFTVDLDRPLGDRALIDPRFYPPVPLTDLRAG
jgi:hypothetical protein